MEYLNNILDCINTDLIVFGDKATTYTFDRKYKEIKDVRSAAFYTFGQSKMSNKNAVLIINGDYLPSVYTVLTEAWFQKSNFIVIALYKSIYDIETNYLDRCTVSNMTFFDKDFKQFENKIKKSLKLIGPKLFNIVVDSKEEFVDYNNIFNELKKIVKQNDNVFLYNSNCEEKKLSCRINNIEEKYKYGLFSKYLGYIQPLKNSKAILVCPKECLEVDMNILNNRAMCSNFKVVVIGNIDSLFKWIDANNIKTIGCKNIVQDIENLYKATEPTILNIKGDV